MCAGSTLSKKVKCGGELCCCVFSCTAVKQLKEAVDSSIHKLSNFDGKNRLLPRTSPTALAAERVISFDELTLPLRLLLSSKDVLVCL